MDEPEAQEARGGGGRRPIRARGSVALAQEAQEEARAAKRLRVNAGTVTGEALMGN